MPNSVTATCNLLRNWGQRWALLCKTNSRSLERAEDVGSTFQRIGADNGIVGIWRLAPASTVQT